MTPDHGENPVPGRPPAGGDAQGPSRFDIVLRGYDRRQVEDHIATLERTITRQRGDLEQMRGSGAGWSPPGTNGIHHRPDERPASGAASLFSPGTGPRPSGPPRHEPGSGGLTPEMISSFTTRLQSILHAAEEEAEEVRANARNHAQAEEQACSARLEELERRRQGVLAELGRVRSHLDGLLSHSDSTPVDSSDDRATTAAATPTTPPAPEPNARPEPSARPVEARSDHAQEPTAHPGQARPNSAPLPNRAAPSSLPKRAAQSPSPSPSRTPSSPGPNRPAPTPGSGGQGNLGGSAPAQPKPRPTPSPRPRTAPPSPGVPAGDAGSGRPEQAGGRNGSAGRGNDSDGGRSAFGSGAH